MNHYILRSVSCSLKVFNDCDKSLSQQQFILFILFYSRLGDSPNDEKLQKPIPLGQCPIPCERPGVSEAVPGKQASSWHMVTSMITGEVLLAGFLLRA